MKKIIFDGEDMDVNIQSEYVPILSKSDENTLNNEELPEEINILPLMNNILLPGLILPIHVSRETSKELIQDLYDSNELLGVVAQIRDTEDLPKEEDIYKVGTVASVLKIIKMPDDNLTAILQGRSRFKIDELTDEHPHLMAKVSRIAETYEESPEFSGLMDEIRETAIRIIKLNSQLPNEAIMAIKNIESDSFLLNFIVSNLPSLDVAEKQKLLELDHTHARGKETLQFLHEELSRLEIKKDIQSKVRNDLEQQQREYFLNQQMRTIQEELGGINYEEEVNELRLKAKKKKWSAEVKETFEKELTRFQRMNPQASEYSVQRNYLELLLDLPWSVTTKDNFDLKRAQRILDSKHYGLEDIKKRIIEYLAVLKLKKNMKAPILCLYGPPGVGKTSLGASVAESLGRKYVRMSLGGMRDEAEIRGHRKTYIGAMPGRIVQNIKKSKSSNPVFILDEIDKLSQSMHGDPTSAMLEVLDPEQNNSFYDNYLEMGYDLSKVFFIATANNIADIPAPLRDRMEMIEVNGYTTEEKIQIAKKHLLKRQIKENGLKKKDITVDEKAIRKLIESYTLESGVRGLEKVIAKVVRNTAKDIAMESDKVLSDVKDTDLQDILGPAKIENEAYHSIGQPGVGIGLAWTPVGGQIMYIETVASPGKGQLSITGNLGKVMKESATIALQYLKANAKQYGIKSEVFKTWDFHIHVPEGATPKDGPSAGIILLSCLTSLLTQRKLIPKLAMTGEITLRGQVLPVGGIKEKILGAKRAGIKTILMSDKNKKDIDAIQPKYIKGLDIHFVSEMSEVLDLALEKKTVKQAIQFSNNA